MSKFGTVAVDTFKLGVAQVDKLYFGVAEFWTSWTPVWYFGNINAPKDIITFDLETLTEQDNMQSDAVQLLSGIYDISIMGDYIHISGQTTAGTLMVTKDLNSAYVLGHVGTVHPIVEEKIKNRGKTTSIGLVMGVSSSNTISYIDIDALTIYDNYTFNCYAGVTGVSDSFIHDGYLYASKNIDLAARVSVAAVADYVKNGGIPPEWTVWDDLYGTFGVNDSFNRGYIDDVNEYLYLYGIEWTGAAHKIRKVVLDITDMSLVSSSLLSSTDIPNIANNNTVYTQFMSIYDGEYWYSITHSSYADLRIGKYDGVTGEELVYIDHTSPADPFYGGKVDIYDGVMYIETRQALIKIDTDDLTIILKKVDVGLHYYGDTKRIAIG